MHACRRNPNHRGATTPSVGGILATIGTQRIAICVVNSICRHRFSNRLQACLLPGLSNASDLISWSSCNSSSEKGKIGGMCVGCHLRPHLNASGGNHQSSPVVCRSWTIVASDEHWSHFQGIFNGGVGDSETGPGAAPSQNRPVLDRMGTGFHVLTCGAVGTQKSSGLSSSSRWIQLWMSVVWARACTPARCLHVLLCL